MRRVWYIGQTDGDASGRWENRIGVAGDIGGRASAKVYGGRPERRRCDRRGNRAGEDGLRGEDVRWEEVAVAPGVGRTCETATKSGRDSWSAERDRTRYQNKNDEAKEERFAL